jgi:thiol-disulfide isomerase/thioredoxin
MANDTDGRSATATPAGSGDLPNLIRSIAHRLAGEPGELPVEGRLASFDGATGWLNSEPLTPEGLKGRVVLVDFWTYTCINWLRTLPYVRAWHARYAAAGLTIVGVHTPEFAFERDVDNIRKASAAFAVEYPVAIDSEYGVWQAFANHFWPAIYLADADGRIRFHHFGEGEYAMTEMAIQQLLLENGAANVDEDLVDVHPQGLEVAAEWRDVQSPESYTGYLQSTGFASDGSATYDESRVYTAHDPLGLNQWDLSGTWNVGRHAAVSIEPRARLAFEFHARDLNLVMGPVAKGSSIPFRVFLDGQPATAAHGTDVEADASGVLDDQRTYQLIRQTGPIATRRFEIEFGAAGAEAYCFTFG